MLIGEQGEKMHRSGLVDSLCHRSTAPRCRCRAERRAQCRGGCRLRPGRHGPDHAQVRVPHASRDRPFLFALRDVETGAVLFSEG